MIFSSSAIAMHAAGFDPISDCIMPEDSSCVMCGVTLKKGDKATAWNPKDTFTNWSHLQAADSKHLCPHCAGAWRSEFTQAWATGAIFNHHGVHKANSADTLAHALLNPPETPFLWVRGDQKQQHLVWRTPITTDANLLRVRLGEKVATIRRLHVLAALKLLREAEVVLATLPKDQRPVKKANPGNEAGFFKYLDWNIDSVDHSLLSDSFIVLTKTHPEFEPLRNILQTLNFGEIWALMILLKSKNPTKPEIVAKPK